MYCEFIQHIDAVIILLLLLLCVYYIFISDSIVNGSKSFLAVLLRTLVIVYRVSEFQILFLPYDFRVGYIQSTNTEYKFN